MTLKERLGKRIQEFRKKKNLKQAELAEIVGIATKTQSSVETGKSYPSAELMERYAKAFDVDISELLKIDHIRMTQDLASEINSLVNRAKPEELILINRVIKSILL